jgi:hypothetical protein
MKLMIGLRWKDRATANLWFIVLEELKEKLFTLNGRIAAMHLSLVHVDAAC